MDARDTSGLFVLAGIFIIVVQGGFVGRWSKQKGDRWLGSLVHALAISDQLLTRRRRSCPWYDQPQVSKDSPEKAKSVSLWDIRSNCQINNAGSGSSGCCSEFSAVGWRCLHPRSTASSRNFRQK
jgi:hypothetical protein